MYTQGSINAYLEDLAARKPAPGGGSAAALGAATGVSLMSMVLNYTAGNQKYKASEGKTAEMLVKTEKYRVMLAGLIDEDVAAYAALAAAFKRAKDTPAELEAAYRAALMPPYEVARIAYECLKLCATLPKIGNPNLITDTAIAAIFLEGAFVAAKFNVYINLKYIKDMDYVGSIHAFFAPLEEAVPKMKEEILEMCEEVIER